MDLVAWVIGYGVLAVLLLVPLPAQEGFAPPQAYPVGRYELGWRKNPFTVKIAPVAVEHVSFARDLAIAGCFGAEGNPSVVIVNTRTHERTLLKKGDRAPNGMTLNSVTFTSSRKETMAQVSLGDTTAVLRFDESYIKQFKAQQRSLIAVGKNPSTPAGGLASAPAAVASIPDTLASNYPPAYGNLRDTDAGSADPKSSLQQGRRRLLTAQRPVETRK